MFAVEDVSEIFFYQIEISKMFLYEERKDLTKKSFFQRIGEKFFETLNEYKPDFIFQEDYIFCKSGFYERFQTIPKFLEGYSDEYIIKDKTIFNKAKCILFLTNGRKLNLFFETNEEAVEYIDTILRKNPKTFFKLNP